MIPSKGTMMWKAEVDLNKYMDMAFTDAFSSPRESLQGVGLAQGMHVVQFAAYQVEILAMAKKLYKRGGVSEDGTELKDEFAEYKAGVDEERLRLIAEAAKNKETLEENELKTFLAYYKIGKILEKIQSKKPNTEEMHL